MVKYLEIKSIVTSVAKLLEDLSQKAKLLNETFQTLQIQPIIETEEPMLKKKKDIEKFSNNLPSQ
jgi:hypothetical protein